MKQIVILFLIGLFLPVWFLSAQEEKPRVAIFDPSSASVSVDGGTKEAVRELISSTFVNTGKYTTVERSMLQQIMKEQKLSNTDAFDENQATELGKLAGANKVVLSVISMVGGRNMLSIKIIDVETATIEQQKTKIVSTNDLLDAVEPLTSELLGISATTGQGRQNKPNIKLVETSKSDTKYQPANPVDVNPPQQVSNGDGISLYFAGFSYSKNPSAKIYVNGNLVGTGTLKQGFSLSFSDTHPGEDYNVRVEWESVIQTKDYKINTAFKKQFVFEYAKGGFGYEFRLKK